MTNKTVTLTGSRSFQDIGTIGQTTAQLSGNMQSVNEILDVGLRNTKNISDSFIRVSDLVVLGWCTLSDNVLMSAIPVPGISVVITTAKLTIGGTNGSMTFVDGILTAEVPAT